MANRGPKRSNYGLYSGVLVLLAFVNLMRPAWKPSATGSWLGPAFRKCLKNRNLSQNVARIAHRPAGLIVGAGLVSAQIRAGTRPAPTRMANRGTTCMFWRILRRPLPAYSFAISVLRKRTGQKRNIKIRRYSSTLNQKG
jgi:hypothetical protein